VFINFEDNPRLDAAGFSPFGRVSSGMQVVEQLYSGYGDGAPRGMGPDQGRIQSEGNAYLDREFPKLDRLRSASLID
jgi:peptidyl-prolyl cis-trans isomerase A (cyclophilin A)